MGGGMVVVVVLLVALLVGGGVYFALGGKTGATESAVQSAVAVKTQTSDCDTDPYLDVNSLDAINLGTTIGSETLYYNKGSEYLGTMTEGSSGTKFSLGDKGSILVSNASYIDTIIPFEITKCGSNVIVPKMYKLATDPTFRIFGSTGDVLTDSATGGATNQSNFATPTTFKIEMTLASDEGDPTWVCVAESVNDTNVKEMTLSSSDATVVKNSYNKPNSHAQESASTNTLFRSWTVSGVKGDGSVTTMNLLIEPETGKTVGTPDEAMYFTCYPSQAFVETDGSFKQGIENVDGTAKFEASRDNDYDFYVV